MARVAFILDELFEDSEFQVPYDRVRDAGHEPVIVGLQAASPIRRLMSLAPIVTGVMTVLPSTMRNTTVASVTVLYAILPFMTAILAWLWLAGDLRQRADLLDLTHDTIFARDMNDVITYWNRGAEEMYGWTAEEALGKSEFVHQMKNVGMDGIAAKIAIEVFMCFQEGD